MFSPTQETHIPTDMFSNLGNTSLVMCSPTQETHIPSDMLKKKGGGLLKLPFKIPVVQ